MRGLKTSLSVFCLLMRIRRRNKRRHPERERRLSVQSSLWQGRQPAPRGLGGDTKAGGDAGSFTAERREGFGRVLVGSWGTGWQAGRSGASVRLGWGHVCRVAWSRVGSGDEDEGSRQSLAKSCPSGQVAAETAARLLGRRGSELRRRCHTGSGPCPSASSTSRGVHVDIHRLRPALSSEGVLSPGAERTLKVKEYLRGEIRHP